MCANYETQLQALQARVKEYESKWHSADEQLENTRALLDVEREKHSKEVCKFLCFDPFHVNRNESANRSEIQSFSC